jgi:hypothetical protein
MIIFEEAYNPRHELVQRLRLPLFLIQNSERRDAQNLPHLFLGKAAFQPPSLDPLAQGLGYKIKRLFSQYLKANPDVWQKGNASMLLRLLG